MRRVQNEMLLRKGGSGPTHCMYSHVQKRSSLFPKSFSYVHKMSRFQAAKLIQQHNLGQGQESILGNPIYAAQKMISNAEGA